MAIKVLFLSKKQCRAVTVGGIPFNHMGHGHFEAASAGTLPTPFNPLIIEVLAEMDIDAKDAVSKSIALFDGEAFDFVINICEFSSASCSGRKEDCPSLASKKSIGCWAFDSMTERGEVETVEHLRKIRDQIAGRLHIWMPAVDKKPRAIEKQVA